MEAPLGDLASPFCESSIVEIWRCHLRQRASEMPTRCRHWTSTARSGWHEGSTSAICRADDSQVYVATTWRVAAEPRTLKLIRGHASDTIRRNQTQSDVIRCNQTQSDAIRHNQTQSDVFRRNSMQSDAIRRNQTQSALVAAHLEALVSPADGAHNSVDLVTEQFG